MTRKTRTFRKKPAFYCQVAYLPPTCSLPIRRIERGSEFGKRSGPHPRSHAGLSLERRDSQTRTVGARARGQSLPSPVPGNGGSILASGQNKAQAGPLVPAPTGKKQQKPPSFPHCCCPVCPTTSSWPPLERREGGSALRVWSLSWPAHFETYCPWVPGGSVFGRQLLRCPRQWTWARPGEPAVFPGAFPEARNRGTPQHRTCTEPQGEMEKQQAGQVPPPR